MTEHSNSKASSLAHTHAHIEIGLLRCFTCGAEGCDVLASRGLCFVPAWCSAAIFNSVYFVQPNITNLPTMALQSLHRRHPCPRTSHRIRKNSQEIEKKLSEGKKGRNLQESNRGGSLSRMDRSKRCHVYRRKRCHVYRKNHYRVTTHSMNITGCINSW